MKRCPTCSREYADDELSFCLADGARLISEHQAEPQPTLFAHKPNISPPIAPSGQVVRTDPTQHGKQTQAVPLILMLTAGLVIGLLIAYIALRSPATTTQPAVVNSESLQNTPAPAQSSSTAKETPAKPRPVPSTKTAQQDLNWFVVFGTFSSADSNGANERLSKAQAEGFSAYIVDTDEYSNFTPDKLAVVMGPYSESEAQRIGKKVQFLVPTIKRGW